MKPRAEITICLETIDQLVEQSPRSPFPKPRLRDEAEKFIVEQAADLPRKTALMLKVQLPEHEAAEAHRVTEAIHQHFAFRRLEAEKELARTRRFGWRSLLVGLVFLSLAFGLVQIVKRYLPAGNFASVIEIGLAILAWVALWRPADVLLYDWYPFRRDARVFNKLERAEIQFVVDSKM
jgi:hypothetical protein